MLTQTISLAETIGMLRCPRGGGALRLEGDQLVSERGGHAYRLIRGMPDLMHPPVRFRTDLPWFEPWDELSALQFNRPPPMPAPDLPYHLDAHLASVPGAEGHGRWILEVGCGERRCEAYFTRRGFRYLGTDADQRGVGPHLKADAHNLPFNDESFDFYFSLAVYEHLASPLQAALEAFRILKPGGTIFGTSAFVYGFHDRASFHHMSHAGLLWTLRMAGFTGVRMWPDWKYTVAIPEMAFGTGAHGAPWRATTRAFLTAMDTSFTAASRLARRLSRAQSLNTDARDAHTASSLTYVATKPL